MIGVVIELLSYRACLIIVVGMVGVVYFYSCKFFLCDKLSIYIIILFSLVQYLSKSDVRFLRNTTRNPLHENLWIYLFIIQENGRQQYSTDSHPYTIVTLFKT